MKNPWKKFTPSEHYRRLTTGADREAWDHLAALVAIRTKKEIVTRELTGISIEDQTQQTLLHIWEKIKTNKLYLNDSRKFYGLLKVIVSRCLSNTLRKRDPLNDALDLDKYRKSSFASPPPHGIVEKRLILSRLQDLLSSDPAIPEDERRAVMLQWEMDNGLNDLENNTQLVDRLSQVLGTTISYAKAAALLNRGKKRLREIAKDKWDIAPSPEQQKNK